MLEYIKGIITENNPAYVVVEAGSIGYLVNIPLSTFTPLQNCSGEIKLLLHQVIREDSQTLYGFYTSRERELFRLLIGVSGVGPGTALLILSALTPAQLEAAITSGDHNKLKAVKGIGAKTAQRIIVDLKDKIKPSDDTLLISGESSMSLPSNEVYDEALAAMIALGFPRPQSQKALRSIFDADPAIKVEDAIKKAFTMM